VLVISVKELSTPVNPAGLLTQTHNFPATLHPSPDGNAILHGRKPQEIPTKRNLVQASILVLAVILIHC